MLIYDIEDVDINEFKKVFKRKFSAFCENSPLIISYSIIVDKVIVKDKTWPDDEWQKEYYFDFTTTEKVNIKRIREDLEERYPVVSITNEEPISEEVASERLSEGYSLEDIMVMREKVTIEKYKVMKIFQGNNELVVYDLEEGKTKLLGVKIPVIKLMDMIYGDDPKVQEVLESKTYTKYLLNTEK